MHLVASSFTQVVKPHTRPSLSLWHAFAPACPVRWLAKKRRCPDPIEVS